MWVSVDSPIFCRVHRLLHTPTLYNKVHYIHHAYDPPFALAGELQHPVEFLFNILVRSLTQAPRVVQSRDSACCLYLVCPCVCLLLQSTRKFSVCYIVASRC